MALLLIGVGCTDLAHSVRHTRFLPGTCGAVATVVVGLPKELSGRSGTAAAAAVAEVAAIRELAPDLAVEVVDERLTTVIAQRSLIEAGVSRRKRKGKVDKVAAAVILQSYLDAHR